MTAPQSAAEEPLIERDVALRQRARGGVPDDLAERKSSKKLPVPVFDMLCSDFHYACRPCIAGRSMETRGRDAL